MRQRIARATGALFVVLIPCIMIGFVVGWGLAFVGLAAFALYTLARLHMEAK